MVSYISWYDSVITHHSRTVVYQSKLWWSMVRHGTPWHTTAQLRCVMTLSYTMVYTAIYHKLPWCTMVYHCTTTMCYDTVVYRSLYVRWRSSYSHCGRGLSFASLVVNWSNRVTVTQIDGQKWADIWLWRNKHTGGVAYIGLCIQQSCGGSSHWLEDTKNKEP